MNVVCDTNPLIYLLGEVEPYSEVVSDILDGSHVWISIITELELFGKTGLSDNEVQSINEMVEQCFIADLNSEIKMHTKRLMQQNSVKLADAIIASTSLYLDFPLITADKNFAKLQDLDLILIE